MAYKAFVSSTFKDLGGTDQIQLGSFIKPEDLTFNTDPTDSNDLIIVLNPGINEIHVEDQTGSNPDRHIEKLIFLDGASVSFNNYDGWTYV